MKSSLPYTIALALAQTVVIDLAPACRRIEIAGSLRRKKPEIGDIEIVLIPDVIEIPGLLFSEPVSALPARLAEIAPQRGWKRIKGGQLYQSYDIGPCQLDLYITSPEKWGVIFTLRTGSADYSHRLVTPRRHGGLCPSYLRVGGGRVWHGEKALDTPEESDVFHALEIAWLPPEKRVK